MFLIGCEWDDVNLERNTLRSALFGLGRDRGFLQNRHRDGAWFVFKRVVFVNNAWAYLLVTFRCYHLV